VPRVALLAALAVPVLLNSGAAPRITRNTAGYARLPGALLVAKSGSRGTRADQGVRPTSAAAAIAVDYPADGSRFPPEIVPPTFLFRDPAPATTLWRIDVTFASGAPALHATSRGARLRVGPIDPDCVAETNRPPRLTPQQAASRTWVPERAVWETIKRHSVAGPATIAISGYRDAASREPLSRGRVTLRTSRDPVGAPVFYRDVPLMPTETETGVIRPLATYAQRLIAWRLRDIGEPSSHLLLDNMPMCANCHSFSRDGKTLGMDLDGLQNNKGLYILAPVAPTTAVRNRDVIQWSTAQGRLNGVLRIGFMSQVSPDGSTVVTTIDPTVSPSNYYVANFKDYRFLQVFYPTRGILAWYNRESGILQPLPGADDPRYVQTNAVWSPDGRYLVFARAAARDPNPPGMPLAKFANDPNELPVQYDLYRIPFNGGHGGVAEPIAGASANGRSNTFPKVSPDGRWIVYVRCHNGLLMRPDSELYIVPATGGAARRLRANAPPMNSWHSFSPNGRWLVFSSKRRSPYTQMYLTHLDEEGNDTPAILIENSTASNRAVNLPEFVNIPPGGLREIGGPAIDYYRLYDRALYLQKQGRNEESAAAWKRVLEARPDDELARNNLGLVLLLSGRREEAAPQLQAAREARIRRAVESNPASAAAHGSLGVLLLDTGRAEEALPHLRQAVELAPQSAAAHVNLSRALQARGEAAAAQAAARQAIALDPRYAPAYHRLAALEVAAGAPNAAIAHWRTALELDPKLVEAHHQLADTLAASARTTEALVHWRAELRLRPNTPATLQRVAWVLATSPEPALRDGVEAAALAARAVQLAPKDPSALDALAAAYAEKAQFADAALTARRALALAAEPAATAIRARAALYDAHQPYRERR
jgi:tetratricopeptide (TPR) repeat protein